MNHQDDRLSLDRASLAKASEMPERASSDRAHALGRAVRPTARAAALGRALRRHNMTIATAESCTGGLVAAHLTAMPGSSDFFVGGFVTYSNAAKQALLGVPAEILRQHGAVSEAAAASMAVGARSRLAVDVAVSVTGIAGPTGASPEKPIGLVYVGVATACGAVVRRRVFSGTRAVVRRAATVEAIEAALAALPAAEPTLAGPDRSVKKGRTAP